MIFLDTSGIYALADTDDAMHDEAVLMFESAQGRGEEMITHSYVLSESVALLQRRLGFQSAMSLLVDASDFTIVWVDQRLHEAAVAHLQGRQLASLSLVDAVSFQVMRDQGITEYLGFDKHFSDAGFSQYSA